jgi:hypothetical protein
VQPQASVYASLMSQQQCIFNIDKNVIDNIIGELLFDPAVEYTANDVAGGESRMRAAKKNAMKLFTYNEEDKVYSVSIKSILKMNMIIKFVAVGVSFHQASRLYQSVKEETGLGVLGCARDKDVAQHCQIICAVNLQYLKDILGTVWAFLIGLDAGNNAGTSYLDVRVRCFHKEGLQNFHMLAIPMRDRHTGEYQFELVCSVLNVIAPNWKYRLIGIATDGASAMTGCISGTCTRLARECYAPLFRIWCGAHQLDLVMKKAFISLCDDKFIHTLTGATGHLR